MLQRRCPLRLVGGESLSRTLGYLQSTGLLSLRTLAVMVGRLLDSRWALQGACRPGTSSCACYQAGARPHGTPAGSLLLLRRVGCLS